MSLKSAFTNGVLVLAVSSLGACGATNMDAKDRQDLGGETAAGFNAPARTSETNTARQRGPMASSLTGPDAPTAGVPFTLVAQVERRVGSHLPVRVTLKLPASVKLESGLEDQLLAPASEAKSEELSFVVRAQEIPVEDIVLVIDVRGEGFGYHAEHPYRFGRPAPVPVAPVKNGRALEVNGRNFGRTIPISR